MTRIDQFASVFRAAAKAQFTRAAVVTNNVLVATDLPIERATAYSHTVVEFLGGGGLAAKPLTGHETSDLGALIERVRRDAPDLVVTYRNLHSEAWRWPYTLGDHVEVLTQVCDVPILLLPRFDAGEAPDDGFQKPSAVVAMTDHLAGDDSIVNWSVALAKGPAPTVVLAHVEDDLVFERYIRVIGKTPDIETDLARRELRRLLLHEPTDWIETVARTLASTDPTVRVVPDVSFGHHLATYRRLLDHHQAELLVMHTKDEDQLAMHGGAYPLAVELRRTPLLLL